MTALLSKGGKDLTVAMLLDALQQTKDFENSIAKKFAVPVGSDGLLFYFSTISYSVLFPRKFV